MPKQIPLRTPDGELVANFTIQGDRPTAAEVAAMQTILRRATGFEGQADSAPPPAAAAPAPAPQAAPAAAPQAGPERSFFQERVLPFIFPPLLAGQTIEQVGRALPERFQPSAADARAGSVGASVAAGTAVGSFGGPPGAALGAILGGIGGALGADAAGQDPSSSVPQGVQRALNEGAFEAAGQGLGPAVSAVRRGVGTRIARIDESAAGIGERFGISLGIEDVSGSKLVAGARNILGKFPAFGTRFNQASARRAASLADIEKQIFDDIIPVGDQLAESELGRRAFARGSRRFQVKQMLARSFERRVVRLAEASPNARVPTTVARETSEEILDRIGSEAPVSTRLEAVSTGVDAAGRPTTDLVPVTRRLNIGEEEPLERIAQKMAALGDEGAQLTPRQAIRLKRQLGRRIGRAISLNQRDIVPDLIALQKAVDLDLVNVQGAPQELTDAIRLSRGFFHNASKAFETPAASLFENVDRNVFRLGAERAGSANADQLMRNAFRSPVLRESASGVRQFRELVGDRNMRRGVRSFIETQFDESVQIAIADSGSATGDVAVRSINQWSRSLGLFRPKSAQREALQEMLRGTGTTVEQLESFVKLARQVAERSPVDPSTFIARRAVLGGFRGITGGLVPGRASAGADVGAFSEAGRFLGFLIGGFKISDLVTDPKILRDIRRSLQPNATENMRRALTARLVRQFGQDPTPEQEADLTQRGPEFATSILAGAAPQSQTPFSLLGALRGAAGFGAAGTTGALREAQRRRNADRLTPEEQERLLRATTR